MDILVHQATAVQVSVASAAGLVGLADASGLVSNLSFEYLYEQSR